MEFINQYSPSLRRRLMGVHTNHSYPASPLGTTIKGRAKFVPGNLIGAIHPSFFLYRDNYLLASHQALMAMETRKETKKVIMRRETIGTPSKK